MIFRIAFNVVGFGMLIGLFFYGIRLFSIGFIIRERNVHLIGKGWNGRLNPGQLRKLKAITNDESSKQAIERFSKYYRVVFFILIVGIFLFLVIGFLNNLSGAE